MNILFTGAGRHGSWQMRGIQLAAQRASWRAVSNATKTDLSNVDVVVVVKNAGDETLNLLRHWRGPIVYDPLDFWTSFPKRRNEFTRIDSPAAACEAFGEHFRRMNPALILCPTRAMAEDIAGLGIPVDVFYHHFDPRLETIPPNTGRKKIVLCHGAPTLGLWKPALRASSFLSNAKFIATNAALPPPANVLVAVRGGRHTDWITWRWKSNIKAATALRLGLPLVAWPEASYLETHPSGLWFRTPKEMHGAIKKALQMGPLEPQHDIYSIEWCAKELERILVARLG
jgi:hypothetical protein